MAALLHATARPSLSTMPPGPGTRRRGRLSLLFLLLLLLHIGVVPPWRARRTRPRRDHNAPRRASAVSRHTSSPPCRPRRQRGGGKGGRAVFAASSATSLRAELSAAAAAELGAAHSCWRSQLAAAAAAAAEASAAAAAAAMSTTNVGREVTSATPRSRSTWETVRLALLVLWCDGDTCDAELWHMTLEFFLPAGSQSFRPQSQAWPEPEQARRGPCKPSEAERRPSHRFRSHRRCRGYCTTRTAVLGVHALPRVPGRSRCHFTIASFSDGTVLKKKPFLVSVWRVYFFYHSPNPAPWFAADGCIRGIRRGWG